MSDLLRYASQYRVSDPTLYRALVYIDSQFNFVGNQLGGIQNSFVDAAIDPTGTAIPPAAQFAVAGIDGKYLITIVNPQNALPLSVPIMQQQIAQGQNLANVPIIHNLQSATAMSFNADSGVTDYGNSSQLAYEIQDPNQTKFWRIRSSFDGVNWNDWQVYSSPLTCGPVGVWSGLLRNLAQVINTAATTPDGANALTQSGTSTEIDVAASVWKAGTEVINYDPGSVDPGSYGTFFVYGQDPERQGGTITFIATTNDSDVTSDDANIYFGVITTSSGGGGGGSGGGGGTCCRAGVLVVMHDGSAKDISEIQIGDILEGIDGDPEIVQRVVMYAERPCFRLEFDGSGKLTAKTFMGKFTVYGFETDRTHTYLVGQTGIVDGAASDHRIQFAHGGFTDVFSAIVGDTFRVVSGSVGSHNFVKA